MPNMNMNDASKDDMTPAASDGAQPTHPDSAPHPAPSAAPPPPADDELAGLRAENAALKDRILREIAEMENLRRRTEREVADARAYGVANFARDMLPFSDNITRALENTPRDADGSISALLEGLGVMERDFLSRLARHGVKKLEPLGQKFDPNLHEALFEAPDDSVPTGTVVQVMETGFTIGERVLRPAKVGVSRGGPKA